MENLIIDCRTGEKTRRELTLKEVEACKAAAASTVTGELLQQQKYERAIERLRSTEMGRDVLTLLGVDK